MKTFISTLAVAASLTLGASATWAQADDTGLFSGGQTVSEASQVFDRMLNVDLRAGMITYNTLQGQDATDFATGVSLDWNLSAQESPLRYGATTGLFYTPLNSAIDHTAFIVPVNAYAGYQVIDRLLLSAHAGVNGFFQGDVPGMRLGANTDGTEIAPNVGAEAAFGITRDIAATLRTDWSLVDGANPFIGTVGVSLPLG